MPRFTQIPNLAQSRDIHIITAIGRLRQGVSIQEAQAELDILAARFAREYPATNKGWGIALDPLQSALVGHTRRMLMLLFAVVALMLLIASVNVANLMLVRTQARSLELAMRSALGAAPARLIRQILAEGMLLAVCGGFFGVAARRVGCGDCWCSSRLRDCLGWKKLPSTGGLAAFAFDDGCRIGSRLWALAGVACVSRPAQRRRFKGRCEAPQVTIGGVLSCCSYRVSWQLLRYC